MSTREKTVLPKEGDIKEAGDSNVARSPTRDSGTTGLSQSHVPQSPTCRKIFFDENFKVSPLPEASVDVMEQQRLKWNFDFETETPLPGRYLWMRTQGCSGYYKNGKEVSLKKRPQSAREGKKRSSKRTRRNVQPDPECRDERKDPESGGSCDTALNELSDSRKPLRLSESPLELDWT